MVVDWNVPDEGLVVDERVENHDKLAVHPVRHPSVPRDQGVEVLDAVGPLDGRHEEAPERRHQRPEDPDHQSMHLDRLDREGGTAQEMGQGRREDDGGLREDPVGLHGVGAEHGLVEGGARAKLLPGELFRGPELLEGASEVREAGQEAGEPEGPQEGEEEGADEALPGLVGREAEEGTLDESPPHAHPAHVGHDVVDDDARGREEIPKNAAEDVGGDHFQLTDDEEEDDHGPRQLSYLVLVEARSEGQDGHDEEGGEKREGAVDKGLLRLVVIVNAQQ